MLISAVQQSDSVLYIYVYTYTHTFFFIIFFSIMVYHRIFNKFIYSFIYFWLSWVFVVACGLSLLAVSRDYFSLQYVGFSLQWLLLLWSTGSRCVRFSSCDTWAQ